MWNFLDKLLICYWKMHHYTVDRALISGSSTAHAYFNKLCTQQNRKEQENKAGLWSFKVFPNPEMFTKTGGFISIPSIQRKWENNGRRYMLELNSLWLDVTDLSNLLLERYCHLPTSTTSANCSHFSAHYFLCKVVVQYGKESQELASVCSFMPRLPTTSSFSLFITLRCFSWLVRLHLNTPVLAKCTKSSLAETAGKLSVAFVSKRVLLTVLTNLARQSNYKQLIVKNMLALS